MSKYMDLKAYSHSISCVGMANLSVILPFVCIALHSCHFRILAYALERGVVRLGPYKSISGSTYIIEPNLGLHMQCCLNVTHVLLNTLMYWLYCVE